MAFTFGFYNSLNSDRKYDAVQVSQIFDGIISDGVYATYKKAMIVKATDTDDIIIQPGRAWFDHTWNYVDTDTLMPSPASDVTYSRYDAVVLDIQSDVEHRTNAIIWVQGTAAQNPEKPTMIKDYEHHQYPLAYVLRPANSTIINQSQIENMVGTLECPFVTGIIDTIQTDDLILQWESQFEEFMSNKKVEIVDWFEQIKGLLDGDAATNLAMKLIEDAETEFNHYYGMINATTTINTTTNQIIVSSEEGTINVTIAVAEDNSKTTIHEFVTPKEGTWSYDKSTEIVNTSDDVITITEKYSKKLKE